MLRWFDVSDSRFRALQQNMGKTDTFLLMLVVFCAKYLSGDGESYLHALFETIFRVKLFGIIRSKRSTWMGKLGHDCTLFQVTKYAANANLMC